MSRLSRSSPISFPLALQLINRLRVHNRSVIKQETRHPFQGAVHMLDCYCMTMVEPFYRVFLESNYFTMSANYVVMTMYRIFYDMRR